MPMVCGTAFQKLKPWCARFCANRSLFFSLFIGGAALLAGCRTAAKQSVVRPLSAPEIQSIQSGSNTAVLFRLTSTENQQEFSETLDDVKWNIWDVTDWQHCRRLGNRDGSAKTRWRVPSMDLGRAGWRYLILKPGQYFIEPRPVDADGPLPVYLLSVPCGSPIVYAGSFPFVSTNTFLQQGQAHRFYESHGIRDELDAAREAGAVLSPLATGVMSALAASNDLATVLGPYSARTISSIETINHPPHATRYVGRRAAIFTA